MKSYQEVFNFSKTEKLDWSDFIESEENREALAYLTQWPNWNTNGVVITGGPGVGKSHLAALWGQSANAVYILKESLKFNPRELFTSECNFIIDDLEDFLEDQNWIFHFYNIAQEKHRYFLILDRLPPKLWNITLPDLNSRMMSLPTITIQNHGDNLLKRVTQKLAKDFEIPISDDAIDYILQISERNVLKISDILKTLDRLALQHKKNISVSFVKQQLSPDHRK